MEYFDKSCPYIVSLQLKYVGSKKIYLVFKRFILQDYLKAWFIPPRLLKTQRKKTTKYETFTRLHITGE